MIICICHNLSLNKIQKIVREKKIDTIEELQKHIKISDQCRGCSTYLWQIIDQMAGTRSSDQ
jgi:bacterioferritin-associated ferredoxin